MKQQKQIRSIFKHSLLLSLINYLLICSAIAQSTPKGATIASTSDTGKIGNTWAVIVGISKYQNVQGLNYADKDALAFYDYLVNKKGLDSKHVQLLINEKAIASDIYGALEWLNLSVQSNDRVIFYFSGHGDVETKTIYQDGFLLASDAPTAAYMTKGTISIIYLQHYLETYVSKKAKDVLLIVDACRSGKLAGGSEGLQVTMHALGQNWNNQIIKVLSAQEGESSFEDKKWGGGRGVFSYYLVKGLEGLANRNADSVITASELAAYLPFAVADATGSVQNPTVTGSPKTNLFTFNKSLLALANQQDIQAEVGLVFASRGTNDDLDPEIEKWYDQFRTYLQNGRLIWGEKMTDTIHCAKYYYLKLVKDSRAKTLIPSLKSSFIASLKRKTEFKLGDYIKGNGFNDFDDEAYKEMIYAKSLIDTSYILFDYIKARLLFMEGRKADVAKKAIELFKSILKIEPDAAYAYNEIGTKFDHELDIADSAIYYYKKALLISPTWANTYNELGFYLIDQHRYKESIYYLEHGLKLDSTNSSFYSNLAIAYSGLTNNQNKADSNLDIGIRLNKKLIENDSTRIRSYYNIADLLSQKGDFENAIIYLNKQIAFINKARIPFNVDLSYSYELLGRIYANNKFKRYVEALKNYNLALKLNPQSGQIYGEMARVYENTLKYDKSIECYKKAIVLAPAYTFAYNRLSDIYLIIKDYQNALKIGKEALKLHPEKPENYALVWKVYLKLRNFKEAKIYYNKAIRLDTLTSTSFQTFENFYYDQKDYDNFLYVSLDAVKAHPNEYGNYYNAACGYSLKNDVKKSLEYLKISLEKGYNNYNNISVDTDLTNIRQLPEFKEVMKKYFPNQAK